MVYLDTSVALAHLGAEDVSPGVGLWEEPLISSRLLIYETLGRLHARGHGATHAESARELFRRVAFLELIDPVVGRAAEAFPTPLRTLDAIHLATMLFLVEQGVPVRLASYDQRLLTAAGTVGIAAYPL